MPYCIYLRKSRADAEAELRGEGETLARHEKALIDYARSANLVVNAVYKEIVSGDTIAARPKMQQLLNEVSQGLWEGVIVMDIDRLARGNSIDQGIISQTFLFADTKIITPIKTYDPSNEMDEEYFEFGLFMSRREYKTINRRLQRGRVSSAREGKYVSNKAPYGYERVKITNDKGFTLKIVPEQADVIRNIFNWYTDGINADGNKKRIGTALIARELNKSSLKAATGGVWTSQTIRDILINPVYIGKIRWNWRPTKKTMVNGFVKTARPRSNNYNLFNGLHEPIISEEVFNAAQSIMNENQRRPIRGDKKTTNPLAGLVICSLCGRKMQRRPNPSTDDLLICPAPTCCNHASFLHLVEDRVIDALREWAGKYEVRIKNETEAPEENSIKLKTLYANFQSTDKQLNKAFEAFETGIYDAETFRKRSELLKNRISEIKSEIKAIENSDKTTAEAQKAIMEFIPKAYWLVRIYSSLTDAEEKNKLLSELIDHIDYVKNVRGHGHERDFEITLYPVVYKF